MREREMKLEKMRDQFCPNIVIQMLFLLIHLVTTVINHHSTVLPLNQLIFESHRRQTGAQSAGEKKHSQHCSE